MVVHHLAIGLFHFLVQLVHQVIAVILAFLDTVDIQEQMEPLVHQVILDIQVIADQVLAVIQDILVQVYLVILDFQVSADTVVYLDILAKA